MVDNKAITGPTVLLSWGYELPDVDSQPLFQSVWRVQAATDIGKLTNGIPDLWDSDFQRGSNNHTIRYDGLLPATGRCLYWRVQVKDQNGALSVWSDPHKISEINFSTIDWTGKWICDSDLSHKTDSLQFDSVKDQWIWHPGLANMVPEKWKFSTVFELSDITGIVSAEYLLSADEGFTLWVNGVEIASSDGLIFSWARPATGTIASHLTAGSNTIVVMAYNTYLIQPGLAMKVELHYADGSQRILRSNSDWLVSPWDDNPAVECDNETALQSRVVARMGDMPWRVPSSEVLPLPVQAYAKRIQIDKPVVQASIRLTALGNVAVRINNELVRNIPLFWPGWTDYTHHVGYQRFNLAMIQNPGVYEIELLLSGGWYAGYVGWERGKGYYGAYPAVRAELILEYEDGSTDIIGTQTDWEICQTEWVEADLLMGETLDYRLKPADHSRHPVEFTGHQPIIHAAEWEPVQQLERIPAVSLDTVENGLRADFGRNMAGFVQLGWLGSHPISIRHAEVLDASGAMYFDNIRMARATDTITTEGSGTQSIHRYEPLFTYHGFRYAEISGLNKPDEIASIQAIRIGNALERTGIFKCDNAMLQQLYDTYIRSTVSNLVDIPTDCPQRDERLGWTGDGSILSEAHCRTFNMGHFYRKWLTDLFLSQRSDGALPDISPYIHFGSGIVGWNNAAWSDAAVLVTRNCVQSYGWENTALRFWSHLVNYVDSIWASSQNGIRPPSGHGDWLSIGDQTPKDIIGSIYLIASMDAMVDIGTAIGMDTLPFADYARTARASFEELFVGQIESFSQTACTLCLKYNILPEHTEVLSQRLVEDLETRNTTPTTGFLGTAHLPEVLSQIGRTDLALAVLCRHEFPSWGFMFEHGATTFWEHWDSWHPEKGFKDPIMNSFNHASLGGFSHWFYKIPGWIDSWNVKTRQFRITPRWIDSIQHVEVEQQSPIGKMKVSWEKIDDQIWATIIVPYNTEALVDIGSISTKGSDNFIFPSGHHTMTIHRNGTHTLVEK